MVCPLLTDPQQPSRKFQALPGNELYSFRPRLSCSHRECLVLALVSLAERGMDVLSILIVDDHAAVRRCIRSLMESRSEWKVCGEAADGLEAIEKASALQPHLVLMDLSMPRMGGLEATQIIRRQVPTTKVLVISQNDPTLSSTQAM